MEKRAYLIIGVFGLIAAGGLALFLVFTQSNYLLQWYGDQSGNPTGQTLVITGSPLKPNKFAVMVGDYFEYSNQEHEIGTFNLTRQGTGEKYTVSYELSAGTFVGFQYDGETLDLPPGTYLISADNHHYGGATCNHVVWQIVHAGYLRATGSISGEIPDSAEGWLFGLLGFGAFFLGMGGLIGILKGRSGGASYGGVKNYGTGVSNYHPKPPAQQWQPSFPSASSAISSTHWNAAAAPQPKPAQSGSPISSTELDLIAQAALKQALSQQFPPPGGAPDTKTCPSCGKLLPPSAKFCNSCGQKF